MTQVDPERRGDATLEEFASLTLRARRGGRVKVVKRATTHLALEMSSDEITELREWLDDHVTKGIGETRYVEGQGVPLPESLVRLLQAVTD